LIRKKDIKGGEIHFMEITLQRRTSLPYIALGFAVLSLTLSSLFVRWSEAPGPVTSFYRFGIATLIIFPLMVRRTRKAGLPPLRLVIFPLAAGIFTSLDHSLWSLAVGYTRIANATLLNNVSPLWVALFAVIAWRERLHARFWLGLAITLAGAGLVIGMDLLFVPGMTGGNLLALSSSLFYAGYFLITQRGRQKMDLLTYVWLVDLFGTLGLLVFSLSFGMPLTGFSNTTWLVFLLAALVSQVGGYFATGYALGHLPASVVAPTMVLQPVLTALLAIPITGEMLSPWQWLGGLAVVGGIYLINISRSETV
jgi:drug/metabolite transporter (DMT)-like permease